MLFPPFTRAVLVSVSARVRLYPDALFVATVTVSDALVALPELVGVTASATVVLVVRLITDANVALIVVLPDVVAADTITGEAAANTIVDTPIHAAVL